MSPSDQNRQTIQRLQQAGSLAKQLGLQYVEGAAPVEQLILQAKILRARARRTIEDALRVRNVIEHGETPP